MRHLYYEQFLAKWGFMENQYPDLFKDIDLLVISERARQKMRDSGEFKQESQSKDFPKGEGE